MSHSLAVRNHGVMALMLVMSEQASSAQNDTGDILHAHSEVSCLVDTPFDPDADTKLTEIGFWYAVETPVDDNIFFEYRTESTIYHAAISSVSWCYQYNGNRRIEENGETLLLDRHGRRLGIMAINSAPMDVLKTNTACPQTKKKPDDFCYVYQGNMTFLSHATDDLTTAIAAIRAGIKHAMDTDSLLDPVALPMVSRIVYLGDTEEDVLNWSGGGLSQPNESGLVSTEGSGNKAFVPIVTASIFGATLLAFLLLLVRRKRSLATRRGLKEGVAVAAASSEEGVDAPGSFHPGYYHYTRGGTCYLSPYSQTCIEMERQLALGHGLETIAKDKVFLKDSDFRLVGASYKDIGGKHSAMDVQVCTSMNCQRCATAKDPTFISLKQ